MFLEKSTGDYSGKQMTIKIDIEVIDILISHIFMEENGFYFSESIIKMLFLYLK